MRRYEYLWTFKEGGRTPTAVGPGTLRNSAIGTLLRHLMEYWGISGVRDSHPLFDYNYVLLFAALLFSRSEVQDPWANSLRRFGSFPKVSSGKQKAKDECKFHRCGRSGNHTLQSRCKHTASISCSRGIGRPTSPRQSIISTSPTIILMPAWEKVDLFLSDVPREFDITLPGSSEPSMAEGPED